MTARLDEIAGELERVDPRLALALDQVSDRLDRLAKDKEEAGKYEKMLIHPGTQVTKMDKY